MYNVTIRSVVQYEMVCEHQAMGRLQLLLVTLLVCCSLSLLSVDGRVVSNVIFPAFSLESRISGINEPYTRTTRQINNNRRPLTGLPQTSSSNNEDDTFSGFDTFPSNNNQQWSNNGNQWPNQQQNVGSNRPQNQNQRPNQQQSFGNRPQNQNQWTNNNNQGQSFQGNNGNNNRPTNQNQNQQQLSTTTSSNGVSDVERNRCNTSCRERTTYEYNPVCGSDALNYQNRKFLDCVANCGIPTEFSYVGTCVTTTERSVRRN